MLVHILITFLPQNYLENADHLESVGIPYGVGNGGQLGLQITQSIEKSIISGALRVPELARLVHLVHDSSAGYIEPLQVSSTFWIQEHQVLSVDHGYTALSAVEYVIEGLFTPPEQILHICAFGQDAANCEDFVHGVIGEGIHI